MQSLKASERNGLGTLYVHKKMHDLDKKTFDYPVYAGIRYVEKYTLYIRVRCGETGW